MFVDWRSNIVKMTITQGNLQIQCNPYQITNGIFHRTRTKNLKICMETQKTPNSQSNLEKEKQSWRNQAPGLQTTLQSYSHQNSMVLAQNEKYASMDQDRTPRKKPTHLRSTDLWQRRKTTQCWKDSLFNKSFWENYIATCKKKKN